jgi:HAD domain in Swiss Army Knife RNA repair proteins
VVAKEHRITPKGTPTKPLLLVDIDGVVSLFGVAGPAGPAALRAEGAANGGLAAEAIEGRFHTVDGIPHFLSSTAASHLLALAEHFELVWASGWEERANEHLPALLGLPRGLPFIAFSERTPVGARTTHAHWKLEAIGAYVGGRALAWIDDAFNPACHEWAGTRSAPTLLVSTAPEHGLTAREAKALTAWAKALAAAP